MQKFLLGFLILILGVHIAGNIYGWYLTTHLDIPMHIAGGAWVALFFFYLFSQRSGNFLPDNKLVQLIFALGFVALIGVGWEFYEYLADVFIKHNTAFGCMQPGTLFDTLKDLFDDLIGGTVAAGVMLVHKKRISIF